MLVDLQRLALTDFYQHRRKKGLKSTVRQCIACVQCNFPLANLLLARLLVASHPLETSEGKQYIQLNVPEGVKYGEHWGEVCDGADTVSGAQMVEFMQRATKVSKSQLRTIWQLADHRKEGALERDEFFIALRLLALAQRGAELSMKGLRNFVGIQLIPEILPPKKVEPPPAPVSDPLANIGRPNAASSFSWMAPPELIARYDKFFDGLDVERKGVIDGKQGFTFFSKSGLPRPALRQIWQLADITADGKLDREEFRQAMHLVTGVKNGRITVEQFPERLHPSTPNWLRVIGTEPPFVPPPPNAGASPSQHDGNYSDSSPVVAAARSPVFANTASPGFANATSPIVGSKPGMPPAFPNIGGAMQTSASIPLPQGAASPSQANTLLKTTGSEADEMRAVLQRERLEAEKVRREMEEMQAELERVRLDKEASLTAQRDLEVQRMRQQYEEMAAAKRQAEEEAAKAKEELQRSKATSSTNSTQDQTSLPPIPVAPPVRSETASNPSTAPKSAVPPANVSTTPKAPAKDDDDDDIWDQPSPEASKPIALNMTNLSALSMPPSKQNAASAQDDNDSSDDDDFWGMGAKPSLGASKVAAAGSATTQGNNGANAKSALDDWLF